jgi:hypothetical protein
VTYAVLSFLLPCSAQAIAQRRPIEDKRAATPDLFLAAGPGKLLALPNFRGSEHAGTLAQPPVSRTPAHTHHNRPAVETD